MFVSGRSQFSTQYHALHIFKQVQEVSLLNLSPHSCDFLGRFPKDIAEAPPLRDPCLVSMGGALPNETKAPDLA